MTTYYLPEKHHMFNYNVFMGLPKMVLRILSEFSRIYRPRPFYKSFILSNILLLITFNSGHRKIICSTFSTSFSLQSWHTLSILLADLNLPSCAFSLLHLHTNFAINSHSLVNLGTLSDKNHQTM